MGDGWTPEGKRIMQELDKLQNLLVKVGFQEGQKYPDGTSVTDVAAWNELGTVNMPSRPFMRDSVDENKEKIVAFMQAQVVDIIKNRKTAEQAFKEIGVFQKGLVQETIVNGNFEPNKGITVNGGWMKNKQSGKPFYVKGKHSTIPLIDTGEMRDSVNFVVGKKGG